MPSVTPIIYKNAIFNPVYCVCTCPCQSLIPRIALKIKVTIIDEIIYAERVLRFKWTGLA